MGLKCGRPDHFWGWPQHSEYPHSYAAGEMTKCSSATVLINKSYFMQYIDHRDQHPALILDLLLHKVRDVTQT